MIPIVDVIPTRTTPWVTLTVIALIGVALAGQYWLATDDLRTIIYVFGLIPETPRAATALTHLLLHPGWLAALSNVAALWFFGPNVEDRFGHLRFLLLSVAAGVAGGLAEAWAHPASPFPILGAGGAVGGIVAAYFALYPTSRVLFFLPLPFTRTFDIVEAPAVLLVGIWFLVAAIGADAELTRAMVLGAPPVVAQLGGGIVGGLTVFLLRKPLRMNWSEERVS